MVKIKLSEVPQDRLNRAFKFLADAMAKQPATDFPDTEDIAHLKSEGA